MSPYLGWAAELSAWRCGDSGRYRYFCRLAGSTYRSAFQCYQQRFRETLFTRGSKSRVWWRLTRDIAGFSTHRQRVFPPADDLAGYFVQKFVIPDEASYSVPPLLTDCAPVALSSFRLTCKRVKQVLLGLDESKSVGLDGVSPRVLRQCAKKWIFVHNGIPYSLTLCLNCSGRFSLVRLIHNLGRSLE